jgi:YD repeat-containing protein
MKVTFRSIRKTFQAVTLIEAVVAMAISSLLFVVVGSAAIFSRFSMSALANYSDLEGQSRYALDHMSRAIREAGGVSAFSPTSFTLTNTDGTQVRFAFDSNDRTLSEIRSTGSRVLLKECTSLTFSNFQRNYLLSNFGQVPASATNLGKLVQLNWTCSRTVMGSRVNTESVQSAKVVIRKR